MNDIIDILIAIWNFLVDNTIFEIPIIVYFIIPIVVGFVMSFMKGSKEE